ncbi:MAG: hypothetical protein E6G58_03945 [Actinobacteria bacterium]|nr:MAG: hypothetical protein E6G58_03945 [Actinomycetota bacterium]
MKVPWNRAVDGGAVGVFATTRFVALVPSAPTAATTYAYRVSGVTERSIHVVVVGGSVEIGLPSRVTA